MFIIHQLGVATIPPIFGHLRLRRLTAFFPLGFFAMHAATVSGAEGGSRILRFRGPPVFDPFMPL